MKNFLRIFNVLLLLVLLIGIGLGLTHLQDIRDFLALRDYSAPTRVSQLATDTTMKDKTRKVFYVNHPDLEPKDKFGGLCTEREQTIVLGCFINNKGIYLLDVEDPRLQGIIQVTAAHEVLHAMYDRLDQKEKQRVDKMTADFFATLNDDRIKKNVDNYRLNDPTAVPNELHSILATEVRSLSPELETYYSRYFSNRLQIVSYSEKYEQTFVDIENQTKDYDIQLKSLKNQIDDQEKQINALAAEIEQKKAQMDALLKNNQITQYNSRVDSFNYLVNQYNSLIKSRQNLAKQYNEIVDKYNQLATTETNLINSLKTDSFQPIGGAN